MIRELENNGKKQSLMENNFSSANQDISIDITHRSKALSDGITIAAKL